MIICLFFLCFWLGISFRHSLVIYSIVTVISLILIIYKYKKRVAVACIGVCLLGVGMSYIHFENKSDTYKGVVIEAKENYFIIFTKGEKIYTYAKDNEYEIGDVLTKIGRAHV